MVICYITQLFAKAVLSLIHKVRENRIPYHHKYETRMMSQNPIQAPKMSKTSSQNHAVFLAPKLYNSLPVKFKKIKSLQTFHKKIFGWLLYDYNSKIIYNILNHSDFTFTSINAA